MPRSYTHGDATTAIVYRYGTPSQIQLPSAAWEQLRLAHQLRNALVEISIKADEARAVQNIEALRHGRGEFKTAEEFYTYWRKYKFKIGDVVQRQLDKLLSGNPGYPADTMDEV